MIEYHEETPLISMRKGEIKLLNMKIVTPSFYQKHLRVPGGVHEEIK